MTAWTPDDLARIDDTPEIRIAGRRRDGSVRPARTVWTVVVGDRVYTRSVNGPGAAWFRGTRATHAGHIEAGGIDTDVTFLDVDAADPVQAELDAAYRRKYGRSYPGPTRSITGSAARSATLRIEIAET